jgi:hypothetical protein
MCDDRVWAFSGPGEGEGVPPCLLPLPRLTMHVPGVLNHSIYL